MKKVFAAVALFAASSAFCATTYTGKLVVYCSGLEGDDKISRVDSVEVNGTEMKLMAINSATRRHEEIKTVETAKCTITAEKLMNR